MYIQNTENMSVYMCVLCMCVYIYIFQFYEKLAKFGKDQGVLRQININNLAYPYNNILSVIKRKRFLFR